MSKGQATIEFLSKLHGFVHVGELSFGALDLASGVEYRAHPEFPEGEVLLVVGEADNRRISSFALVEYALLRHAQAMAVIEGGSAKSQYEHIHQHFGHKVGF